MAWFIPRRLLRAPDSQVTSLNEQEASLEIEGLFCGICANRVANSLSQIDGVSSATCDLERATATVQLSSPVTEEALRAAVIRAAAGMPLRRAGERVARAFGI